MQLAGGKFIGNRTAAAVIFHNQGQYLKFIKEFNASLQTLFPQGVQNNPAGAIGRKTGPFHGGLTEIAGVPAEGSLRNLAFRCPIEGDHLTSKQYHFSRKNVGML